MSDEKYVPPAGADSDVSSDEDEDLAGGDALVSGDEEVIATAVSSSTSDSPRHRRKIRRCTVSPAVPVVKKGFLACISLIWRVLATSTLRPFEGCGKTRFLGRKSVPRDLVIGFVPLRCLHPLLSLPLPDVFCFFCHSGASGSPYSVFLRMAPSSIL